MSDSKVREAAREMLRCLSEDIHGLSDAVAALRAALAEPDNWSKCVHCGRAVHMVRNGVPDCGCTEPDPRDAVVEAAVALVRAREHGGNEAVNYTLLLDAAVRAYKEEEDDESP